jgi:hypothetical protein
VEPTLPDPTSDTHDRAHARVASLLFLAALAWAAAHSTHALVERRPQFVTMFAAVDAALPLITRVALSVPFVWLPAAIGLMALAKEWLLRDPFSRLKWNGVLLVLVFVLTRYFAWAVMAPMRSLMQALSG